MGTDDAVTLMLSSYHHRKWRFPTLLLLESAQSEPYHSMPFEYT